MKIGTCALGAALLGGFLLAAQLPAMAGGRIELAQGLASCQAFQNMCAKRCRERMPDDKNCTSDHCTPKLAQCRTTGCWTEGRLYGGGTTCDLKKSGA